MPTFDGNSLSSAEQMAIARELQSDFRSGGAHRARGGTARHSRRGGHRGGQHRAAADSVDSKHLTHGTQARGAAYRGRGGQRARGSGRPRSRWNIQHATGDDEVANFFSSDTSDLVVGEITYYQDDDGQTAGTDKLVTMSVANATPNSVSSRQDRLSFGNVATAETSLKPSVPVNPRIPVFGNIFKKSSADFIGGIPPEELSGDENREPDFYQEDYVKKYDEGAQERAEHLRSSRQNVKKLPVHFLDEDVAMVDVDTLPSSMNSLELSPRVSKKENAGNRFHLDQSKWASSS